MTVAVFPFPISDVKRTPIHSSVIRSAGYDPRAKTLEIEFVTGLVYRYRDVPSAKVQSLMSAKSKGRYFNTHIRDHYSFDQRRS